MAAGERDEFMRAAWHALVAEEIDAERIVFVDEMGSNTSLRPLYAWSPKGKRAFGSAPRNWGKNVTLLASITPEGLGPCLAVEGPTTRDVFEAYLERVLAPTLRPGRVVVVDNLSAHKGGRVKEIVEGRGCELLLSAALLAGLQSDRAGVLEGKGAPAASRGAHPRGADRSEGALWSEPLRHCTLNYYRLFKCGNGVLDEEGLRIDGKRYLALFALFLRG